MTATLQSALMRDRVWKNFVIVIAFTNSVASMVLMIRGRLRKYRGFWRRFTKLRCKSVRKRIKFMSLRSSVLSWRDSVNANQNS